MIPLTRQTLCFKTTIPGSSGCNECNSSRTDSKFALCSVDNWMALTSLSALDNRPKTALESPEFAMYNRPPHIIPTKQHDPTEAIFGLMSHCFLTKERNSSSVARNAFFITSADISRFSDVNSASWIQLLRE